MVRGTRRDFCRMAFNVLNQEMDDHTKNFSFIMKEDGVWHLAPAYDLTGSHFSAPESEWGRWQSRHALSVNGRFSGISEKDVMAVGERFGIGTADKVLARVQSALT